MLSNAVKNPDVKWLWAARSPEMQCCRKPQPVQEAPAAPDQPLLPSSPCISTSCHPAVHHPKWLLLTSWSNCWQVGDLALRKSAAGHVRPSYPGHVRKPPCTTCGRKLCQQFPGEGPDQACFESNSMVIAMITQLQHRCFLSFLLLPHQAISLQISAFSPMAFP